MMCIAQGCWGLCGPAARLQVGPLEAALDLNRAADGLMDLCLAGAPLPAARILGLTAPQVALGRPADYGCRAADLAAVFPVAEGRTIQVDAMWRATDARPGDPFAVAVDLIVSVRTESSDVRPELCVQSVLPAACALRLDQAEAPRWERLLCGAGGASRRQLEPGCCLVRLPDRPWSLALMVHPRDFCCDEIQEGAAPAAAVELRHRLFPCRLERGVILRARVRSALLPQDGDQERAAATWAAWAACEPELGT